jgi:hypothetical protein
MLITLIERGKNSARKAAFFTEIRTSHVEEVKKTQDLASKHGGKNSQLEFPAKSRLPERPIGEKTQKNEK